MNWRFHRHKWKNLVATIESPGGVVSQWVLPTVLQECTRCGERRQVQGNATGDRADISAALRCPVRMWGEPMPEGVAP